MNVFSFITLAVLPYFAMLEWTAFLLLIFVPLTSARPPSDTVHKSEGESETLLEKLKRLGNEPLQADNKLPDGFGIVNVLDLTPAWVWAICLSIIVFTIWKTKPFK